MAREPASPWLRPFSAFWLPDYIGIAQRSAYETKDVCCTLRIRTTSTQCGENRSHFLLENGGRILTRHQVFKRRHKRHRQSRRHKRQLLIVRRQGGNIFIRLL